MEEKQKLPVAKPIVQRGISATSNQNANSKHNIARVPKPVSRLNSNSTWKFIIIILTVILFAVFFLCFLFFATSLRNVLNNSIDKNRPSSISIDQEKSLFEHSSNIRIQDFLESIHQDNLRVTLNRSKQNEFNKSNHPDDYSPKYFKQLEGKRIVWDLLVSRVTKDGEIFFLQVERSLTHSESYPTRGEKIDVPCINFMHFDPNDWILDSNKNNQKSKKYQDRGLKTDDTSFLDTLKSNDKVTLFGTVALIERTSYFDSERVSGGRFIFDGYTAYVSDYKLLLTNK